jgi:hypothetical protein
MHKNRVGEKYNMLLVTAPAGKNKSGHYLWECLCDCGNILTVVGNNLPNSHTKSCGCLGNGCKTHGLAGTNEFTIWSGMLGRCYTETHGKYYNYGALGIQVSDDWRNSFEVFLSDMGPRPSNKHSIERVDTKGNYCKENCIWTDDLSMQAYNTKLRSNNKSGRTGVRISSKKKGTWLAEITFQYEVIRFGPFETFEEAVKAREEAELKYFGFNKKE